MHSINLFQNYNKSRIHSYRGVRNIRITLDDEMIFCGEIARACGGMLGGVDAFGDVSYKSSSLKLLVVSTLSTCSELPIAKHRWVLLDQL